MGNTAASCRANYRLHRSVYATGPVPSAVRLARVTCLDAMHQVGVGDPDLAI